MAATSDVHFSSEKARVLSKVDLSRKGSVDEPIAELVSYVNSLSDFYTTSSCSGRLVVLQEVSASDLDECLCLYSLNSRSNYLLFLEQRAEKEGLSLVVDVTWPNFTSTTGTRVIFYMYKLNCDFAILSLVYVYCIHYVVQPK